MNRMNTPHTSLPNRRAVVADILAARGDALVLASLGNPTYDVAAAGDVPENFYVWGAMGGACMVALGVALAQPDKNVIVFVGDGEMLMGIGSLATIAVKRPENLKIVVLDNEHYGETGMQPAHSGRGVDIAGMALAAGFPSAERVNDEAGVAGCIDAICNRPGLQCVVIKVAISSDPSALPARDGPYLRSRFRDAVLGAGRGGHN